jgi:hypothetical protein
MIKTQRTSGENEASILKSGRERKNVLAIDKADYLIKENGHKHSPHLGRLEYPLEPREIEHYGIDRKRAVHTGSSRLTALFLLPLFSCS